MAMATQGGTNEELYLESLVSALTGWHDPVGRLSEAFSNDEFLLYGQSIAPINEQRNLPWGLEILIRLREEEANMAPPGAFLPICEHLGMMPKLDRWVIDRVADWCREHNGVPNLVLHVNLSSATLESDDFADFVDRRLRFGGVAPSHVCFEVACNDIVRGSPEMLASVRSLLTAGCGVAATGFGRDSASFKALRMVSASVVKIDGSVVRGVAHDPVAQAKIASIQRVCGGAGILTVAEFVEEPEQVAKLKAIGVDFAQGYGIARPEPLPEKSLEVPEYQSPAKAGPGARPRRKAMSP